MILMRLRVAVLALIISLQACTSSPPATPSVLPQPDDPGPAPAIPITEGATFTLTAAGVTPTQARVYQGTRVLFVNRDAVTHQIQSDPLHLHTDCPELNAVDFLVTGQTGRSDPMEHLRGCGFHDHVNEGDARFYGTVWVDPR